VVGGGGGPTDYFVTLNLSWGWVEAVTIIIIIIVSCHLNPLPNSIVCIWYVDGPKC
jgi:hypothetical protein